MDLITSKDLVTSSQLSRRSNLHGTLRGFLGPAEWTRQKNQLQSIANRSFEALQNKVVHKLYTFIKKYIKDEEKEQHHKELFDIFHEFFKKSYFLGVKSSGVGVVSNSLSFAKNVYGNPKIYETEEVWSTDAAEVEHTFWVNFLTKVKTPITKKELKAYVSLLDSHFLAGRVVGAPSSATVYWIKPHDHPYCDICDHLESSSPIPKESLVAIPRSGVCRCGKKCTCVLRIMPTRNKYSKFSLSKEELLFQLKKLKQ